MQLDFISKILKRLFLYRIQPHITPSPNFSQYQSVYRRHHSTETSVLHTLYNILVSPDSSKCTVVIFIDLGRAFDTTDYDIVDILLFFLDSSLGFLKLLFLGSTHTLPIVLPQFPLDVTALHLLHVLLVFHRIPSWEHYSYISRYFHL